MERICTCTCHIKGLTVRHITSCCQFTYEKYLNGDKSIDREIYDDLVREQEALDELTRLGIKLLDRDSFKEQVFSRDGGKCIFCDNAAVDAHHIFDRKLFNSDWLKGGYFLSNGASLCEEHHWEAEKTDISVYEIMDKINAKVIILPKCLDESKKYDKWGNEIITLDGLERRIPGPLFNDDSVQKILKTKLWMFVDE